jgi:glycosyltransferase involved in cell wall biosynthesis
MMPLVSVIMSVHNGGRYLRAAIDSMLVQTLSNFELVIVDDASNDESAQICRDAGRLDSRVVHLTNSDRVGLTASLNRALAVARGQYIARMDADDVSLPQRLERQTTYLAENADIGVVGSFYTEIDEHGHVLVETYRFPKEPIVVCWRMAFENPLPHPPIVARKSLIDAVGGYDERWRTSQDFDLFTRLAAITKLANCPEVLFQWRRHSESVSTSRNLEQWQNAIQISRAYVTQLLGRDIGADDIELLWRRNPRGVSEAARLVETALAVCRAVLAQPRWSDRERRELKSHVSRKLLYELTPYARDSRSWRQLFDVARLCPSLALEVAARRRPAARTAAGASPAASSHRD